MKLVVVRLQCRLYIGTTMTWVEEGATTYAVPLTRLVRVT